MPPASCNSNSRTSRAARSRITIAMLACVVPLASGCGGDSVTHRHATTVSSLEVFAFFQGEPSPGATGLVSARGYASNGELLLPIPRITWSTSDTTIALVDSLGEITLRQPGTVEIDATVVSAGNTVVGRLPFTVVPSSGLPRL